MEQIQLLEKEPRETVREYAYRVLYQNIMTMHLIPGTAMSEQELSNILGVSRTPVREAFIRLSQKGCWIYCRSAERLYPKLIQISCQNFVFCG